MGQIEENRQLILLAIEGGHVHARETAREKGELAARVGRLATRLENRAGILSTISENLTDSTGETYTMLWEGHSAAAGHMQTAISGLNNVMTSNEGNEVKRRLEEALAVEINHSPELDQLRDMARLRTAIDELQAALYEKKTQADQVTEAMSADQARYAGISEFARTTADNF